VVFESGLTKSFEPLSYEFDTGGLLGVPIGREMAQRTDNHHLIIKVLPSPPPMHIVTPPAPHKPSGAT
jgi:hypothetical protein